MLSTVTLGFITFHLVVALAGRGRRTPLSGRFSPPDVWSTISDANRCAAGGREGNWPLLWKEVHRSLHAAELVSRILMTLSVPAFFRSRRSSLLAKGAPPSRPGAGLFPLCRLVGCMVLCVLLVRVVVQAALSFSRRASQRRSLLTCPVSASAIVASKWLGCMLSIRKIWLWLALIWALGVVRGGIPLGMFLMLAIFWAIYAGVSALFGLWCSLVCRTSLRAIVLTLVALGILTSGVLVLPLQMFGFYMTTETAPGLRTWLLRGQVATAPTIVLSRMIPLRFGGPGQEVMAAWEWPMTVAGTSLWLAVGLVFWFLLCRRVRVAASREVAGRMMRNNLATVAADQAGGLLPCPTK